MSEYKHREITETTFLGERVDFVASNDRLRERVEHLSHERHVLDTLVAVTEPDSVFWDVGACLGIHTFVLAKHLPDGQVIGYEPMPTNRGVLMDNMSVNELSNVRIQREALADESGVKEFAIRESMEAGYGRHSFTTGEYDKVATIDVNVRRGDDLIDEGLPAPNVVKIDVEGAGPLVIEGLQETLARDACTDVIIETHEPNPVQPSHEDFGYTVDDIVAMLEDLGFTVDTLVEDFHLHATKRPTDDASAAASLDIEVVQGDIAEQSVDAIVNSAGTTLRMGTGVAGALRDAGGEGLNAEAIANGPVDPGEAVVTDAYALDAAYVIHAASMPHYGTGKSTPRTIRQSVRNALELADENGCQSIAVPAVGCGLGGVPLMTGAEVIGEELRDFEGENLREARLIAYTADEYQTIRRVIEGSALTE